MTQTDKEKIQNAVRIIDRRIEEYTELRTNLTAEQYNSQYPQTLARIIQDYKLIKSKLIPEEKSTLFFHLKSDSCP